MIKYDVLNRFTGDVQFTAEIDCLKNASKSRKLRLAVEYAIENNVSLSGSDLRGINLRGLNLSNADFSICDLRGVNLRALNLRGLNLSCADLSYTDLSYTDLSCSDMRRCDVRCSDLSYTDLSHTDMRGCDLSGCSLRGCDLSHANLSHVNFTDTKLSGAGLLVYQTDIWTVYIQKSAIRIADRYHSVKHWLSMSDEKIAKLDSRALSWWKNHKTAIFAIHATLGE